MKSAEEWKAHYLGINSTTLTDLVREIRQEYDKALREAVFKELCQRYVIGRYMQSLRMDFLEEAINEAKVEV